MTIVREDGRRGGSQGDGTNGDCCKGRSCDSLKFEQAENISLHRDYKESENVSET